MSQPWPPLSQREADRRRAEAWKTWVQQITAGLVVAIVVVVLFA